MSGSRIEWRLLSPTLAQLMEDPAFQAKVLQEDLNMSDILSHPNGIMIPVEIERNTVPPITILGQDLTSKEYRFKLCNMFKVWKAKLRRQEQQQRAAD